MLVFVSMCPGDLASASVLAAIARPPYYYVIIAFHSFIFLQTVQEKMCSKLNYLQKKYQYFCHPYNDKDRDP